MSCKSTWIDHIEPRLVIVDGLSIRNQLLGDISLSHELGTALLRRWAQIDRESEIECPDISFKHVLQLDFSTLALAEGDIVNLLHIEKQFIGEDIPYPIESCQFIFALEEGWTVYMWDHACPGLSMFLTPVADHLDSIGKARVSMMYYLSVYLH